MDRHTINQLRCAASVRYGVAILSVLAGFLAREALGSIIPTGLPFIFFFPAVTVAAWYGGAGPGVLSVILSAFVADWAFIGAGHGFTIANAPELAALAAFVLSSLIIVIGLQSMHGTKDRLRTEISDRSIAQGLSTQEKELLAVTLASIGDGVIATDREGRITFINREAERLCGWPQAEAKGQPMPEVFRIINEQTRRPIENPVDKVLRTGSVVGLANHAVLIGKNGNELPIDDSAAPIRNPDGTLSGVVLVFRDVTEKRAAEKTQLHLAAIVEHSGDVIVTKNLNGIVQSWNASAQKLFGYTADEIVGQSVTKIFPPDRLAEEDHILGSLRQGKAVERLETIRLAKDGTRIPVAVSISPMKDNRGNLIGASKIIHNISELVAAREALVREKELLRTTLASIGDAVIVTDAHGAVTFMNAEAERLTGWNMEDAGGKSLPEVFRIINEASRQTVENPVDKVLRRGGVVGLANHTILMTKSGTEIPIDDSAAPIRTGNETLYGVVLVFRDFSARKKTETALRESEERLRQRVDELNTLLDVLPAAVWISDDPECRVVKGNKFAARLYGLPKDANVSQSAPLTEGAIRIAHFKDAMPMSGNEMPMQRAAMSGVAQLNEELELRLPDGRTATIFGGAVPLKNREGKVRGVIATFVDVTDRKRMEVALRDSQRANRLLAEVGALSAQSRVVPEFVTEVARLVATELSAIRCGYATVDTNSDGAAIECDFHSQLPSLAGSFRPGEDDARLKEDAEEGRVTVINDLAADQRTAHLYKKVYQPLAIRSHINVPLLRDGKWAASFWAADDKPRDWSHSDIELMRAVGDRLWLVIEQIRVRSELRTAHEQLANRAVHLENLVQERTGRLNEMIGDLEAFSYSIVHDMRGPLRAMQSFAQLLVQECGPVTAVGKDYLHRIETAAARMDRLIQDGLHYSRMMRADLPLSSVNLNGLLRGIIETYPNFQPPNAEIILEENLPAVLGNDAGLTQCISNILGNAVKFVATGVRPSVHIWAETHGDRVKLLFKDNGIGVPPEAHEKIFQIFQRLENSYEGTGIGLAIVKKAAERMGGTIELESEPGKGSTFWIELHRPPQPEKL